MWHPDPPIKHDIPAARWPSEAEAAGSRWFSPVRIGPLTLEQRTWVPAMVPWRATEEGDVTPEVLAWYERFAQGRPGAIVVEAIFRGIEGDPVMIGTEMDRIAKAREESQPLRSRTGGSTFKNPPGHKAWALVDAAGCRGLRRGDAQVSEKHCNFLLNLGNASSSDIEELGEEVRRRVQDKTNITLEWEIQRIGVA